jgi:hypothetical protein
MDTVKTLIMELFSNPMSWSVKNWVTAIVIVVVIHQFVL